MVPFKVEASAEGNMSINSCAGFLTSPGIKMLRYQTDEICRQKMLQCLDRGEQEVDMGDIFGGDDDY